jgi:hypothetical protein
MAMHRASYWVQLGQIHDLRGERDRATSAYRKALREPDWWEKGQGSSHSLARRYLRHPYTEREFLYGRPRLGWLVTPK